MEPQIRLFPEQASSVAWYVDLLYFFLLGIAVFFTALICVAIFYFAIRYRRSANVDRSNAKTHNITLEILWSVIPLVLTMVAFAWGAKLFFVIHEAPEGADEIYVVGKQWMWKIQHANGKSEINELHVPVGRPVKLKMISEDVIHSFYVPAFRVKMDVLPGRYSTVWFTPTKTGRFHLFCAEYCGTEHSRMGGHIIVMEPSEYAAWLAGTEANEPPAVAGQKLFERHRCNTCHLATSDGRCPPLAGLFGRQVQLSDGTIVEADEHYLRESIIDPNARIVAGYQPVMPTYQGQLDEQSILQIIAYIESLSQPASDQPVQDETNTEPESEANEQ